MIKKYLPLFIVLVLIMTVVGARITNAQSATLPQGCASTMGYSTTSGAICNGTSTATLLPSGCTSTVGYSTTNGAICNGTSTVSTYLEGCTSADGYSTLNGAPCNGAQVATIAGAPVTSGTTTTTTTPTTTAPGLPTTGEGGNAPMNTLLLVFSGMIAIVGSVYLVRTYRTG